MPSKAGGKLKNYIQIKKYNVLQLSILFTDNIYFLYLTLYMRSDCRQTTPKELLVAKRDGQQQRESGEK